ncbi:MAG: FprA family A-type flavoprotein [Kiritimatiellaeota bacterium]|nr:FprA family A-type flavoprotein [Kiritimatiellota bacterium]
MTSSLPQHERPEGAAKPRKIRDGVFWIGAVHWERRLFDALIPLPDGTSYNAYLVRGSEKTALIDAVDPDLADVLMGQLDRVDTVDYLVSQHAEQDHSGAIPQVLARYPSAKVVANPKAKGMLMDLLAVPEEAFITVEDGETLSLGDKTLEFVYTPWVHWPETMSVYLREDKVLFSCDLFGSHIASTDLFATDEVRVYEAAKRYYAEIMMPFRSVVEKDLAKLAPYDIALIAPSHGPVYPRPSFIVDAYNEWVSGPPKNVVVLPYISMHGSTKLLVDRLTASLVEKGVTVELFDLAVVDIGKLAMALVDAGTIVIGTPTVLVGPHPNVAYAALLANLLRPKVRFLSVIGSYGWRTKAVQTLADLTANLKVEVLDPVFARGLPAAADYDALDQLATRIAALHKENGFA